jgi:hypothetical protein
MFIQQLRDKHTQWQHPETKNIHFKNFKTAPAEWAPSFGIERDNNGYFYLSDNLFAYCNLRNGLIVRIRRHWSNDDWQCYTELHQLSQQTGEFRVDIPLYREVLNVGGSNWEYACKILTKHKLSNNIFFIWKRKRYKRKNNEVRFFR